MDILVVILIGLIIGVIVRAIAGAIEPTRPYADLLGIVAGGLYILAALT